MAVKMNDFLLEYYRRLIFRGMPIEQFVQFCSYAKKKDYAGNMKDWAENLLELDSATGAPIEITKGVYQRKNLPDPTDVGGEWELTDDEWKKFFKAFQKTFQAMDANKNRFKYNDKANKFLNAYFGGTDKLFNSVQADRAAEAKIAELRQILEHHPDLEQLLSNHFSDDFSWDDLLRGIDDKDYNKNPKFRERLISIASALDYDSKYNADSPVRQMVGRSLDLEAIKNGFATQDPSTAKMTEFKAVYSDLLKELLTNSKAYEAFSANDSTKISKMLEEAKSRVDYDDKNSDSYVPAKRKDELSPAQQISDWWDETYSNYLEKYTKFTGDRMFFSGRAKAIFKEIDKQKIKPTDGIAKILENSSKILDALKLKDHEAFKQFKWFNETMGKIKDTMPKAFDGALKNGRQMRAVISEMIMIAVRDDKIKEAKTAMEVLSVCKFGYTTSKIMDAFNSAEFKLFSDEKLSWNKNEATNLVAKALDKSLKVAFKGIGYGVTMAGNAIRLSGSKFRGRRGRMKNAQKDWDDKNTTDKAELDNHLSDLRAQKIIEETNKNNAATAGRLNDANIDSKTAAWTRLDSMLQQRGASIEETQAEIQRIDAEEQNITHQRDYYDNLLLGGGLTPSLTTFYTDERDKLNLQLTQLARDKIAQNNILTSLDPVAYNTSRAAADTRGDHIKKFREASANIAELDANITAHETEQTDWNNHHQDQYKELMAYWDMLESGRDTKTGKMYTWFGSKENRQTKFDAKTARIIADAQRGYSYTA